MTLSPDTGNDIAVLNLVRTDGRPNRSHRLADELTDGELIVNLRAEGDPDVLQGDRRCAALRATWRASTGVDVTVDHSEHSGPESRTRPIAWPRHEPTPAARILYCHCAYARVVPPDVKADVLDGLSNAGVAFEAVPDLCEMSARGDPRMRELAAGGAADDRRLLPARRAVAVRAGRRAAAGRRRARSGTCAPRPADGSSTGLLIG